jgi:hypothetical protein
MRFFGKPRRAIRIQALRSTRTREGEARVAAEVDGRTLWFASRDAELTPSPEAFASALLVPAATRGVPIELDAPVDPTWLANVPGIQAILEEWWGLPGTRIEAPSVERPTSVPSRDRAQCFSGGVDSWFSLLEAEEPPRVLLFVHGFDVPLEDQARLEAFLPGFREIAEAFGARPVVVRTNLRAHPTLRSADWERMHGGALAAVGHTLVHEIESLLIPPSYPYHAPRPWGTSWRLDPLWSSRHLAVLHGNAPMRRTGKVHAIAHHPLARKHLRVCWENRAPVGNCSRCAKCVRTMLNLETCGHLVDCEAFDSSRPLDQLLDGIPRVLPRQIPAWHEALEHVTHPSQRAAIERLIARSNAE